MGYLLRIKGSARRELARIDKPQCERLIHAIDKLAVNPYRGSLLKGELSGLRRIRVGEYRVIYEIDGGKLTVLVVRVRHRRDAYRRSR
ncbi:type II toxin-antitoxin system RelE family toxin [Nitrosococcus wardiae]|uniref:Type II toxin-antitoxin system RelE/ParE family toxin n=1 Tax=Nitrosococcus wardiae TaxID=1814290 RepID=A0A4P7BTT3_9GAMM|nr:type II toxin-antitoxin system RelE/ParE family toxin [Nitrosococcus wardiae]QBQ53271.1 type II toxin-antitoxin system RelE/ParE family toxin [Nitrosococcus wardiae]